MRLFAAAAMMAALLISGCEDGAPEPQVRKVEAANSYSDQLKGLSEIYRHLGLRRAIMDNKRRCKRVDSGGYQQQYKTMAMWTARCSDTGDWAIYIAPNGDVQVSECKHARQLGLPECKVPAAPAKPEKAAP